MNLSTLKFSSICIVIMFAVIIVHAFAPSWWIEQEVISGTVDQSDPTVIQDNYKPALIGQAKNMAQQAYLAMEAQQAGSAGSAIENMVTNFSIDPADNYAPLLIGQLKAIAQPFYDRFTELNYDLGDINVNVNGYPWDDGAPIEDNYKPANLGQLKYVFSFDLSSWQSAVNMPPIVSAGADVEITLPTSTIILAGTASDPDDGPNILTTTWSMVSGPGSVSFSDASALNSQATFSGAGSYVLQLLAGDGADQSFDEVVILVTLDGDGSGGDSSGDGDSDGDGSGSGNNSSPEYPEFPSRPVVSFVSRTLEQVEIEWTESTHSQGINTYQIYRNGVLLGETNSRSFIDSTFELPEDHGIDLHYEVLAIANTGTFMVSDIIKTDIGRFYSLRSRFKAMALTGHFAGAFHDGENWYKRKIVTYRQRETYGSGTCAEHYDYWDGLIGNDCPGWQYPNIISETYSDGINPSTIAKNMLSSLSFSDMDYGESKTKTYDGKNGIVQVGTTSNVWALNLDEKSYRRIKYKALFEILSSVRSPEPHKRYYASWAEVFRPEIGYNKEIKKYYKKVITYDDFQLIDGDWIYDGGEYIVEPPVDAGKIQAFGYNFRGYFYDSLRVINLNSGYLEERSEPDYVSESPLNERTGQFMYYPNMEQLWRPYGMPVQLISFLEYLRLPDVQRSFTYSQSGDGEVRIHQVFIGSEFPYTTVIDWDLLPFNQNVIDIIKGNIQLSEGSLYTYIEGIKPGPIELTLKFKVGSGIEVSETYHSFVAPSIDLDVDSDNTTETGYPNAANNDRSKEEDDMEDENSSGWNYVGKVIASGGDSNGDKVPDHADFTEASAFVPLVLEIPDISDSDKEMVAFNYSGSDPAWLVIQGDEQSGFTYTPAPGDLRIWKKDSSQSRNKNTIKNGGDFIRPGEYYTLSELGVNAQDVVVLYVEAMPEASGYMNVVATYGHKDFGVGINSDTVTLLKVDLAVDGDRSGTADDPGIVFGSAQDQTSEERPYYFWVNNDADSGNDAAAADLNPNSFVEDHLDGQIKNSRDLEDFSRLWIRLSGLGQHLKEGNLRLGFKWQNVTEGNPAIRLYNAVEADGGLKYLFDEAVANQQKSTVPPSPYLAVQFKDSTSGTETTIDEPVYFPVSFWSDQESDDIEKYFLFEGVSPGKGELVFVLQSKVNNVYQDVDVSMSGVWFDLKDIKDMYQHFTVGDSIDMFPSANYSAISGSPSKADLDAMGLENDYILMVHGWRMFPWERRYFGETAFKRLYWQNYKGRFGLFSWPTEWAPRVWWFGGNPDPTDPQNYTRSEWKARLSGVGLRQLLQQLKANYSSNLHMFAHSMGNVVASEALKIEAESGSSSELVETFIACQSASVAHSYDANGPEVVESDLTTQTPEVFRNYPPTGSPYYSSIGSAAGTIVNFHNKDDDALSGWSAGQDLKPDFGWGYGFGVSPTGWYRTENFIGPNMSLDFPDDRYEIFAHIAEARSKALGAAVYGSYYAWGSINGDFDLNSGFSSSSFNFKDTKEDHSAQYRATNMIRFEFYRTLLDYFGL